MDAPLIYELRTPKQIDSAKTYPALLVMHGMGSNEQNMLSLVNGLEEHFFIFSIRGPLNQSPGYAYFTIQGYGKPYKEVFDQAVTKLTSFIEYAYKKYPLDLSQIYLLGFSQGAILSMTLALILGERIKGVVALSGYIPGFVKEKYDIKPVDRTSLFISHGDMDQVLPYEWCVANSEYFQSLGTKVTFKTYHEGHSVSMQNLKDFKEWLLDLLEKDSNKDLSR